MCERWGAIGVSTAGGAAEFAKAPVANCVLLPEHVRTEDAALIEPLSCAVRGYDILRSQLATHVLIYGSGTMGLMMLELAKRSGAASVDVVDVNPERLATARTLGCTEAAASAAELERPRGWDVVIDATGNQHAIQDGLDRVGKGGTFLQFGVADYAARASIEPYRIYNQEITITGSMAVLHSFERAAELFATQVLDPEIFISHRLPLQQYPDALEQFAAGVGRKILLRP
jgi:2-desacetyl-2-hydroxyethyl bacteriochlorophyllide A dehydrogenase